MFFFLAQTEQGDVFKITLETDEDMVCIQDVLLFIQISTSSHVLPNRMIAVIQMFQFCLKT